VIFFYFRPSKIRVSPTDIVSSYSLCRCRLSSDRRRHATASSHASFLLSQDELAASASSSSNTLSRRFPSQVDTEAFNPHYHLGLSFSDRPTLTPNAIKNHLNLNHSLHHLIASLFYLLPNQSTRSLHLSLSFTFTYDMPPLLG
jgi:hypothetical protein